jgi:hypothetical protein
MHQISKVEIFSKYKKGQLLLTCFYYLVLQMKKILDFSSFWPKIYFVKRIMRVSQEFSSSMKKNSFGALLKKDK